MDLELKQDWINALESGNYRQGLGRLKTGDRYCCFGVLCDISGKGEWNEEEAFVAPGCIVAPCHLPMCIFPISAIQMQRLARMNDTGCSFEEISAWIKMNL